MGRGHGRGGDSDCGKASLVICVLCVVLGGATTAIVFSSLYLSGDDQWFSETEACSCPDNNKDCAKEDQECTVISADTNAYLCLFLGGILPWTCCLCACCVLLMRGDACDGFCELLARCVEFFCCWWQNVQCCFHRKTIQLDHNKFSAAVAQHEECLTALQHKVVQHKESSTVIEFEIQTGSGQIQVTSDPAVIVNDLLNHLSLERLTIAELPLEPNRTLEAQAVLDGTTLCTESNRPEGVGDQVVIPCPVEFEIAELRKQEPQESKFRYLNDQFVCCSCHSDSDSEEEYQLDEDGQVHVVQTPNKLQREDSVVVAEEFDVPRETAREMLDGGVVQVAQTDNDSGDIRISMGNTVQF